MANPWEVLHSAAEQRRKRSVRARTPPEEAAAVHEERQMQLIRRPLGGHSAYSALMRSHDRVHPRIGR